MLEHISYGNLILSLDTILLQMWNSLYVFEEPYTVELWKFNKLFLLRLHITENINFIHWFMK